MKTRLLSLLAIALIIPLGLSACSGDGTDLLETPETDALKLKATYTEEDIFTSPADSNNAIGIVTLTGVTDGDTMSFLNGRVDNPKASSEPSKATRLLGVNTPESTAQIQPWGVKASAYVKSILWDDANDKQKVHTVVLQNDYATFGVTDNTTSARYMSFLWYQVNEGDDFRLLNLEIIEQCYSTSQLSNTSDFCPYLTVFNRAFASAYAKGRRVNGERDPDYDYSTSIISVSIHELRENYASYGVTSDEGGSGVQLYMTGVIVAFIGNSFVLRDLVDPDSDGIYSTIFLYTGEGGGTYGTFYHVGDVIQCYCRATTYNNNIQLTDLQNNSSLGKGINRLINVANSTYDITERADWWTTDSEGNEVPSEKYEKVKIAAEALQIDAYSDEFSLSYQIAPTSYYESTFTETSQLDELVGQFVTVDITIRAADSDDNAPTDSSEGNNYYRASDDKDYTFYGYLKDTTLKTNIYLDSGTAGQKSVTFFKIGYSYRVSGYYCRHSDTFQLQMINSNLIQPYYDPTPYEMDGTQYVRGYCYYLG